MNRATEISREMEHNIAAPDLGDELVRSTARLAGAVSGAVAGVAWVWMLMTVQWKGDATRDSLKGFALLLVFPVGILAVVLCVHAFVRWQGRRLVRRKSEEVLAARYACRRWEAAASAPVDLPPWEPVVLPPAVEAARAQQRREAAAADMGMMVAG